jgi:hypothetical protein
MRRPRKQGLRRFGPWTELTRTQARAAPPDHLLTISVGDDDWSGAAGFHFVNAMMYFRSTKPLPPGLRVEDVWLEHGGGPVTGDE